MNQNILLITARNILAASLYILGVSALMTNGEKLFGNVDKSVLGPFPILLLFCLSAAVVGGLVFGYSIYLFLDGKKKESITATIYSIGWLGLATVITLFAYYLV